MRKCNCSGQCGSQGLTRREFLELTTAGAAGAILAHSGLAQSFELPTEEVVAWKRALLAPDQPRVYQSGTHTDARLHLGGIGTGNIEIGVDGQLTNWQLFNTLRDGYVPLFFGLKIGETVRLLQTTGGPPWPRVQNIEMRGEYPMVRLRFLDRAIPVELELEAFSPFAPLHTELSSVPLAAFVFRLKNPTGQDQSVSLAAFMQNPVGYDARGENDWENNSHPNFGANVNEPIQESRVRGLLFRAVAANEPTLDKPVTILAGVNLKGLTSPPSDTPANLRVQIAEPLPGETRDGADRLGTVIWLEDAPADLSETFLQGARALVEAGATLLLCGRSMPLLRQYAAATGGKPLEQASSRPDILFEDFERGYANWKVEGDAFGQEPAHGTLPNQQRVSGFLGSGLVNTYLHGDDTTGQLTSKPFVIERRFIKFLIGGGRHANTQIRLLVDGKVVRAASGKDNERLEPASWDVHSWEGQTGQIVIVDAQQGGWAHINIDQIVFSDEPANRAVLAILDGLLPARFSDVQDAPARPDEPRQVRFANLDLLPNATRSTASNGLQLLTRPLGKGRVILAAGQVLDPAEAELTGPRHRAYAVVCDLVGAHYSRSPGQSPSAPGFGSLALAALEGSQTVLPGFQDWHAAWDQFTSTGCFTAFQHATATPPTPDRRTACGAIATSFKLEPGASLEVPFLLTWQFPNKFSSQGTWMGCHYAGDPRGARGVLKRAADVFPSWRAKTESFRRTFYDSTLPYWLLDGLTANAAIIRHIGVVFRIANGDVYGWEGSNGCCQPTCTHVWGYEQTLSRLFPDLEREMRRIDFKHQQRPDGGVNNRTDVPSPPRPTGEQPFADGHASCILKAYREALNSPDKSFFKEYWPHIRKAVEYLIQRDARSHGNTLLGYLEDDQWNTYDEALHGVTTFISGYYLAALRAGEEWARRVDDQTSADRWHALFEQGQRRLVELCWNGEYFQQHLPDYESRSGEVGPGCMADQLIGQWWAHQLGLGYILPREKVVTALRSVFKYNFKTDLTGWKHMPRAFAGAKDKGLIICTWPKGGRPGHVMLYSDEVWTGIEYQVAAHLIYEGLVEEGLAIFKAARDRYDGRPRAPIPRNPWNEIECGGHYARAMSSWSVLLALSGWEYDAPARELRLKRPIPAGFRGFWCGPEGWGTLVLQPEQGRDNVQIQVVSGKLEIQTLVRTPTLTQPATQAKAALSGMPLAATLERHDPLRIAFASPVAITEGQALEITLM